MFEVQVPHATTGYFFYWLLATGTTTGILYNSALYSMSTVWFVTYWSTVVLNLPTNLHVQF
jgi:hypothetical protein